MNNEEICNEIRDKVNTYETKMAYRLNNWLEAAELLLGRNLTGKENFKPTSTSGEVYKAMRAMSNMIYRMLTSQKPFFMLDPLDAIAAEDPKKLIIAEKFIQQQLDIGNYSPNLKKAIDWLLLYGTSAVHNIYEPVRDTFLGRKQYATHFKPVSLTSCAFGFDNTILNECGWVCFSDVQPRQYLSKLVRANEGAEKDKIYDDAELKKAADSPEALRGKPNIWVQQRLALAGYQTGEFDPKAIQIRTYYGTLDCYDDGKEYLVQTVNDRFVIRFEEMKGLRPVQVATINTLDIEPLGNGIFEMHKWLLRDLHDVRADFLNTLHFMGANMWTKQKALADEDKNFAIEDFSILELENPEGLKPLAPHPQAIGQLGLSMQALVQEFRQSSGATDTLQALVSGEGATATEVSLAMNESVRNISCQAEADIAPVFVKGFIKVVLENAQKYITKPTTVKLKGVSGFAVPATITPSDLLINVDVLVKTMTDQDFRPQKLQRLMTAYQLQAATPPNAITGKKIDSSPTLLEILRLLDVPNWDRSVSDITEQDMLRQNVMSQMQASVAAESQGISGRIEGMPMTQPPPEQRMAEQQPGRKETREIGRADSLTTPVGQVMSAPGDTYESTKAVRSSEAK